MLKLITPGKEIDQDDEGYTPDAIALDLLDELKERIEPLEDFRAYLENAPLDGVLRAGPISTKQVVQELQRYMAREIRRTAKAAGADPASLCDVKERTLRSWVD